MRLVAEFIVSQERACFNCAAVPKTFDGGTVSGLRHDRWISIEAGDVRCSTLATVRRNVKRSGLICVKQGDREASVGLTDASELPDRPSEGNVG